MCELLGYLVFCLLGRNQVTSSVCMSLSSPRSRVSSGVGFSSLILLIFFPTRALRATTPGWMDAENDQKRRDEITAGFTMRALTGGMTNAVFRCSKPGGDNQTVLLRSYGKGTEVSPTTAVLPDGQQQSSVGKSQAEIAELAKKVRGPNGEYHAKSYQKRTAMICVLASNMPGAWSRVPLPAGRSCTACRTQRTERGTELPVAWEDRYKRS